MEARRMDAQGGVRLISCEDGLGVAQIGNICAVLWRDSVEQHRFERQKSGLAEVISQHPGRTGFLCVIEPTAKPPDDKLRKASSDMLLSHGDKLKCVACVIEGSGFKAAVTRSALSGISLLIMNRKAPISYFATTQSAAVWMNSLVAIDSVQRLVAEVENLRSLLPPFSPPSGTRTVHE